MEKKGFWNFWGLTSRNDVLEIEKQINLLDVNSRKRQLELIEFVKNQNIMLNKNLFHIDENIKTLYEKLCDIESVQKEYFCEQRKLLENIETEFAENEREFDNRNEKRKQELIEQIVSNNDLFEETHIQLRKYLRYYTDEIYKIVSKIDEMDPVVNLDKIENLLKILIVNDMMGEIDKLDNK